MIPSTRTRVRVCVALEGGTVGWLYGTHVDENVPLDGYCAHNRSNEEPRDPYPRTNGGAFSIGLDVPEHQVRHVSIRNEFHLQEEFVDTQRSRESNDYLNRD